MLSLGDDSEELLKAGGAVWLRVAGGGWQETRPARWQVKGYSHARGGRALLRETGSFTQERSIRRAACEDRGGVNTEGDRQAGVRLSRPGRTAPAGTHKIRNGKGGRRGQRERPGGSRTGGSSRRDARWSEGAETEGDSRLCEFGVPGGRRNPSLKHRWWDKDLFGGQFWT